MIYLTVTRITFFYDLFQATDWMLPRNQFFLILFNPHYIGYYDHSSDTKNYTDNHRPTQFRYISLSQIVRELEFRHIVIIELTRPDILKGPIPLLNAES